MCETSHWNYPWRDALNVYGVHWTCHPATEGYMYKDFPKSGPRFCATAGGKYLDAVTKTFYML